MNLSLTNLKHDFIGKTATISLNASENGKYSNVNVTFPVKASEFSSDKTLEEHIKSEAKKILSYAIGIL